MRASLIRKAMLLDEGSPSIRTNNAKASSTTTYPMDSVSEILRTIFVSVEKRESNKVRVFGEWKMGKLIGQIADFR